MSVCFAWHGPALFWTAATSYALFKWAVLRWRRCVCVHKRHYLNIFIKKKHFLFLKEESTHLLVKAPSFPPPFTPLTPLTLLSNTPFLLARLPRSPFSVASVPSPPLAFRWRSTRTGSGKRKVDMQADKWVLPQWRCARIVQSTIHQEIHAYARIVVQECMRHGITHK